MDLFSPDSLRAWQERLNSSSAFASAAADWSGNLVLLESSAGGDERSSWVVVNRGRCDEARAGRAGDRDSADFILAATPDTWRDLATARTTPAAAAMLGRLKLLKGDVMALVPHAKAAAELLAAAAEPLG